MTLTQSPDIKACRAYAKQGFNRVPIFRTVLADTETPLSAYNKLARGPNSFLFESVQGGERWGRYSIIGLPASHWLAVNGYTVDIYDDGIGRVRQYLICITNHHRFLRCAQRTLCCVGNRLLRRERRRLK